MQTVNDSKRRNRGSVAKRLEYLNMVLKAVGSSLAQHIN